MSFFDGVSQREDNGIRISKFIFLTGVIFLLTREKVTIDIVSCCLSFSMTRDNDPNESA